MKSGIKSASGILLLPCILLFLLSTTIAAFGQAGRGSITGSVTDQTGAVIPGASVTLLDPATGVARHTAANDTGHYAFISLNPGVYQVTASRTGFTTVVHSNVSVTVDQTTTVDLALKVGNVSQVITVKGVHSLIEFARQLHLCEMTIKTVPPGLRHSL